MTTAWTHLKRLVEIGARPIGTKANQVAADYIQQAFIALDLEVEEQPYACTAWEHTTTYLETNGIQQEAHANAFSPACDVETDIITVGTIAQLAESSAKGKILLAYGDLARSPLSPKSWFLKSERDDRIIQQLENIKPAAILSPPTETEYVGQFTEDWELDLPAATIPLEVALELAKDPGNPVRLCIQAKRVPGTARNILARTTNQHDRRLVLCAHFDTKINTPGASDNAGGVSALLSVAEALKDQQLPIDLEFVAFNGEEYLPMGDEEYLHRSESYFRDIATCINFDGIGTATGSNSITTMGMNDSLVSELKDLTQMYPGVVWVEPWPESNHSTFAMRGIPAIAFSAVGTRSLAHSLEDTMGVMHPKKIDEAVDLTTEIVPLLSTRFVEDA